MLPTRPTSDIPSERRRGCGGASCATPTGWDGRAPPGRWPTAGWPSSHSGSERPSFAGLASLSARERALLVADSVERLDARDVSSIVGVEGARLDRLIRQARLRYAAAAAEVEDELPGDGPTADRVRSVAARALA